MITINKELFYRLLTSLESMTDYADDGMLNRNDPDYKYFFESLDEAREVINAAYRVIEGGK